MSELQHIDRHQEKRTHFSAENTLSSLSTSTEADVASCNNARDQNLEAEVSLAVSFAVCNHQKLEARKPQNEAK